MTRNDDGLKEGIGCATVIVAIAFALALLSGDLLKIIEAIKK